MNLSEQIESLFDQNVVEIIILKNPKANTVVVQAKHFIMTGSEGNRLNIVHQTENGSLVAGIEQIKKQVDHINDLQTKIVQIRGNNG